MTNDKLALIQFSNYNFSASYCRKNRGGGGVAILTQDHLESIERTDITDMSIEYILEVCASELPHSNLLLIIMYWNRREEDKFYEQLNKILKYISNKYWKYNIVIGGDFNIDVIVNNPKTRKFLDLMSEHNFTQHITHPTHITQTASTCLDLIFTNFRTKNLSAKVVELGFSDHSATILNLELPRTPPLHIEWKAKKRLFNRTNIEKFKSELNILDWNNILTEKQDINANYDIFSNILIKTLNRCIPKRQIKLKNKYNKKWLTKGIKLSCKNKRLLKTLAIKSNNHILKQHYKKYSKILKNTICIARKLQYINKLNKSSNKVKTMWDIIKERTNKKQSNDKSNIKLRINDILSSDPTLIANTFNNFFAQIGASDDARSPPRGRPVMHPTQNSMFLAPATYKEIHNYIKTLKNKNSHGLDELPPSLIRQCADQLALPFTILINQSFHEGIFPDYLKKAIIKPIHKKNSKTDPNHYRPIALLPTASKIFEKAMSHRVLTFCEKYKIFDDCQNGFRKNRSTTLAVYKYIHEILNAINSKKYAVGILLDMTKAYDKVQYEILLNKLYGIGIRGIAHKWFSSYLKDREQFTEVEYYDYETGDIKRIRSGKKIINASIPQGSVIGCLLFLIYINDLPKIMKEPCILFADDISLLTICKNNLNLTDTLNSLFERTNNWMNDHNLQINYEKTKIMTYYPHQKTPLDINYSYTNYKLDVVDEFTLLGLVVDTHLNWKSHIKRIRGKLSSFAYALREIKKSTDLHAALVTYYAYAHAWLSYGIILWGNSTDSQTLFTAQKKLIRILVNVANTESCKSHFQQQKILTVPCMYILEICKFVHKYPDYFTQRDDHQSSYSLRHRNKLRLPPSYLKIHSHGTYAMSVKIYNKLPTKIKTEAKNTIFIRLLKEYLVHKCYYSINEYLEE